MNKLFTFLCLLLLPVSASADMQFFLSSNGEPYNSETWTSDVFPDNSADFIAVEYTPSVSPVANEYIIVDSEVKELFRTITSQSGSVDLITQEIEQFESEEYETLISTENPEFIEYITTSINPETEVIIEEKINQNIVLTPFEEVFYNCNISLEERQSIVLDVLDRIETGEIENLEGISYSNPRFGDCIIPFPDISHRETVQENSFISNQLLAKTLTGEETTHQVHDSIEQIIKQEKQYQELVIENEVRYSEMFETGIITQSQHKIIQDIQSYYQNTIGEENISYEEYSFLVEGYKSVSEMNKIFGEYLKQGIITTQEYNRFLQELENISQLQKHFLNLLESGEISLEEYTQYMQEGEVHINSKTSIISSYHKGEITEKEYTENIITIQNTFDERYNSFYQFFNTQPKDNGFFPVSYMQFAIMFCFLAVILGGYYFIYKYKRRLGKK